MDTGPRSDQMQTDGGLGQKLKRLPLLRKIKATKERLSGQFLSYGSNQYLPQLIHFCELIEQQQTESPVVSLALSKQISHWTQQIKNRSA